MKHKITQLNQKCSGFRSAIELREWQQRLTTQGTIDSTKNKFTPVEENVAPWNRKYCFEKKNAESIWKSLNIINKRHFYFSINPAFFNVSFPFQSGDFWNYFFFYRIFRLLSFFFLLEILASLSRYIKLIHLIVNTLSISKLKIHDLAVS